MGLTYRLVEPKDLPGVQALWREETDWGELGQGRIEWFRRNPCEGSMTVVAVDEDDRVAGECVFMAHAVSVHGRDYRAIRPIVPIVAKQWRGFRSANPAEHPIVQMLGFGAKIAAQRGDGLIFMLPNPSWKRLLRMFAGVQFGTMPLWSLPLPLAEPFSLGEGYASRPLDAWDERVDALWGRTARLHGCLMVRDARALSWKIGVDAYSVTIVERDRELVGLAASMHRDNQWLICDVLSADLDASLRATLAAACNLAQSKFLSPDPRFPFKKVAVMAAPGIRQAVEALGFERDNYEFLIAVNSLRPDIKNEEIAPEHWYSSAND